MNIDNEQLVTNDGQCTMKVVCHCEERFVRRGNLVVLVLDDGNRGNLIQSLGIVEFLPAEATTLNIRLKGPSYFLPGRKGKYKIGSKIIGVFCLLKMWKLGWKIFQSMLVKKIENFPKKKFELIISTGSFLAPINLLIAKMTQAKTVNIMVSSMIPFNFFDVSIIPYHDFLRLPARKKNYENLLVTLGSPNCITPELLDRERQKLERIIKTTTKISYGSNVIGVLVGGDDQNYRISVKWVKKLLENLGKINGKTFFLFTTSRRTDKKVVEFLKESFNGWAKGELTKVLYSEFPGYTENSYYFGILGLSDYILVTEDSINMISESITGEKPVLILGVEKKRKKKLVFDETMKKLVAENYAEYLSYEKISCISEKLKKMKEKKYEKLEEAKKCARKILEIMK